MSLRSAARILASTAIAGTIVGCAPAGVSTPTNRRFTQVQTPQLYLKINPLWWIASSVPPVDYERQSPLRRIDWFFRNPLHNFSFYVIGVSDHVNSPAFRRYGTYPNDNFSPAPGWNICVIHYYWLRLPYIAYWNRRLSFYAGWRLAGEFGLKLNFFSHPVDSP